MNRYFLGALVAILLNGLCRQFGWHDIAGALGVIGLLLLIVGLVSWGTEA